MNRSIVGDLENRNAKSRLRAIPAIIALWAASSPTPGNGSILLRPTARMPHTLHPETCIQGRGAS